MQVSCGPQWFYGVDSFFDLFTIITALLIAFFSFKAYHFTKEKKYFFFSLSFLLLALAFVVKIVMYICIYMSMVGKVIGPFVFIVHDKLAFLLFKYYGMLGFIILMLFAMLILAIVALRIKDIKVILLLTFFTLLIAFQAVHSVALFHLVTTFLLIFITYHFFSNHLQKKGVRSMLVALSFLMVFISQILFIFSTMNSIQYFIGECFQLAGFILLLITFIMITTRRHAYGKKNKNRNHQRHVDRHPGKRR